MFNLVEALLVRNCSFLKIRNVYCGSHYRLMVSHIGNFALKNLLRYTAIKARQEEEDGSAKFLTTHNFDTQI
jgi:hypothetical protein